MRLQTYRPLGWASVDASQTNISHLTMPTVLRHGDGLSANPGTASKYLSTNKSPANKNDDDDENKQDGDNIYNPSNDPAGRKPNFMLMISVGFMIVSCTIIGGIFSLGLLGSGGGSSDSDTRNEPDNGTGEDDDPGTISAVSIMPNNIYCGSTWTDAADTCGEPCPGGLDSECAVGMLCFGDITSCGSSGGESSIDTTLEEVDGADTLFGERVVYSGGPKYFKNSLSGSFCMEITDSKMSNQNPLQLSDCDNNDAQQFEIGTDGRIRSIIDPNYCIEAGYLGPGSPLKVYECHEGAWQQYNIRSDGRIESHDKLYIGSKGCTIGVGHVTELQDYHPDGGDAECAAAQKWEVWSTNNH
jgi:hypothetical protein